MSGWNYRLVKTTGTYPKHMRKKQPSLKRWSYIGLHEVYYDDNGIPDAMTKEAITIGGKNVTECRKTYEMMKEAFEKPVLLRKDLQK